MSEDQQQQRPSRLTSVFDDDIEAKTTTTTTTSTTTNMTAGAEKAKSKFAPTIPTTRRVVKKEDEVNATSSMNTRNPNGNVRGGRGGQRGGRGGRVGGLLNNSSSTHQTHNYTPVAGPFSLGPAAAMKSSNGLIGGLQGGIIGTRSSASASSGSRIGISGLGRNGSSSAGATGPASLEVDDEIFPVNQVFTSPTSTNIPVFLQSSEESSSPAENAIIDLNQEGRLYLLQMPPVLPDIENPNEEGGSKAIQASSNENWPNGIDGRIGRIVQHASGKTILHLNNGTQLLLRPSLINSSSALHTNIVAIDPDYQQCFNLGAVGSRLVALPDLASLDLSKN